MSGLATGTACGARRLTRRRNTRRKFSAEFMNRIDKVIVFRTLQRSHLEKILEIELGRVQERITGALSGKQFVFKCTEEARDFLLAGDRPAATKVLPRLEEAYRKCRACYAPSPRAAGG